MSPSRSSRMSPVLIITLRRVRKNANGWATELPIHCLNLRAELEAEPKLKLCDPSSKGA